MVFNEIMASLWMLILFFFMKNTSNFVQSRCPREKRPWCSHRCLNYTKNGVTSNQFSTSFGIIRTLFDKNSMGWRALANCVCLVKPVISFLSKPPKSFAGKRTLRYYTCARAPQNLSRSVQTADAYLICSFLFTHYEKFFLTFNWD